MFCWSGTSSSSFTVTSTSRTFSSTSTFSTSSTTRYLNVTERKDDISIFPCAKEISHRIHVWYICLHLAVFNGKCRQIYHTWILWVLFVATQKTLRISKWKSYEVFSAVLKRCSQRAFKRKVRMTDGFPTNHPSGQFITTFPAGWSPQMVVIVRESPPKWP